MQLYARGALDPRWTTHHTPVVVSFMLATIDVVRLTAGGQYNFETGKFDGGSSIVTSGWAARVQPFGIIGDNLVGQDPTARRLYRVQLEKKRKKENGAIEQLPQIRIDDKISVTACAENPDLIRYLIDVRGVSTSSNPWVVDLVCEVDQKGLTTNV